ncbi:hypothetical protein HUJ04_009235 [Dendroctonus ponderosae]|nr:hypothetical protein HUJ04_009235 [Dendroctonus ponderosae]
MNHENFLLWFENRRLKKLAKPSIIILDTAPYHSKMLDKIPNTRWNNKPYKNGCSMNIPVSICQEYPRIFIWAYLILSDRNEITAAQI